MRTSGDFFLAFRSVLSVSSSVRRERVKKFVSVSFRLCVICKSGKRGNISEIRKLKKKENQSFADPGVGPDSDHIPQPKSRHIFNVIAKI